MKMKKILAMIMALAMILALAACGDKTGGNSQNPEGGDASSAKVAVFYYTYSDPYIASVRTALDSALETAGVNYMDFDGNNSQTTQNEAIDTALADGYNILVVNQVTTSSSDTAKEIISKAEAKGAKVIFFNRAIEEEGNEGVVLKDNANVCFVGTDAPEAGHMQGKMVGEYVLEHFDDLDLNKDGKISYALMKGEESNVEAIARTKYGVEDANAVLTAAGKPELEYFDPSNANKYQVDMEGAWSPKAATEYMQTNLSQYNDGNNNMIELVICNNDGMAEGVITALSAVGYNIKGGDKTIPVFGVDATDTAKSLIADGVMTGTVKQDAEGMANAICEIVKSASNGTSLADSVSAAAGTSDIFSVAEGLNNKLYVAYAAYTG